MSLPNVSGALWGLTDVAEFSVVVTKAVDFEAQKTKPNITNFAGVLQPIPPRKLLMKPEGQRDWKWYTLWTEVDLLNGWIVQDEDGLQFRVMSKTAWKKAGYQEYELTEQPK